MLSNYLKTTFRNLKRHKTTFWINVAGLSIGMACSILISLWVIDELNVDYFHKDIDQIYQVMEHQYYSGDPNTIIATPGVLAPALKEEIPEIEYAATYTWNVNNLFTKEEKSIKESGIYARQDIFDILSIPLLLGNKDKLLVQPNSIVISQELAQKYFDGTNPVGKGILLNKETTYTVTGVFRALPKNSTIQFDYLLRFEDWLENNFWGTRWENNGPRTLVKVSENVDIVALNEKLKNFIRKRSEATPVDLFLYPYARSYLYGQFENTKVAGGRIEYVWLFSLVAIFVLLIACINFMNLSTAHATKRAKEVGIRKSIGASKGSLITRFIGESVIISFNSLVVSVLLVEAVLPIFNNLTNKSIALNYTEPWIIGMYLAVALVTGLIAGSYPAFYLSSFEIVKTLKGSLKSSSNEVFARKGLVVFQFALSVILIVTTVGVYKQIQYTQSKNLGYDKENLITFVIEDEVYDSWEIFRQEILNIPGVKNISRSNHSFRFQTSNTNGLQWPGKDPDANILFERVQADYDLVETMGFNIVEGRSFSREFSADTARIILNQTAADIIGYENPVGNTVTLSGNQREIIGIVEDFHFQSLRYELDPLFIVLLPEYATKAYVRIGSEDIIRTLANVEQKYKEFNTNYPFSYNFFDEQYAAVYRSEMRIGELAKYFSVFAILISCLGLFGLSAFTAEQRAKEIGIRKVLGASVRGLVLLLTKDFTRLVLTSILIGIPVSWYLINQWIDNFAYRAQIEWWIFLSAGLLALIIAWVTVGWQSIRAANVNPVESLKNE